MKQKDFLFIKLDIDFLKGQIAESESRIADEEKLITAEEEFIPVLIAHNMKTDHTEKLIEHCKKIIEWEKARIENYKKELREAEAKEKAFLQKLHGIEDPELKEMATAFFIDLESCEAIGKRHFLERTTVYKKIQRYFEA